jgi:putative SOS response-associated peptidase YedK
MCYGFYPVVKPMGGVDWVPREEFFRMHREGRITVRGDGFHYVKDDVGVYTWRNQAVEAVPMYWDLVPRHFLKRENLSQAEMLRQKNSRAKGSKGFSSYNARSETVEELFSFRDPWREGKRMATQASAFRERPNMDGAPPEFKGKEYEVHLDGQYYLAGIWDAWENLQGERLESCTIITVDSLGNSVLRGCPLILDEGGLQEWLDPKTTPERAREMFKLFPAGSMEARLVPPPAKPDAPPAQQTLF